MGNGEDGKKVTRWKVGQIACLTKNLFKMKRIKRLFKFAFLFGILLVVGIWGTNKLVQNASKNQVYSDTESIPCNRVGLLLGTGKILANGRVNLYYTYRIEAAVRLYKAGKVEFILVSGDNSKKDYDKPSTIKNDLMAAGVPEDKIFLDYAGFRTLDSIVRSKEIFGQSSITIISQQFHNERAIYIAEQKGIQAVGFNAKDLNIRYGYKVQVREYLARVKMVLDMFFSKEPKFLGEKIEIK